MIWLRKPEDDVRFLRQGVWHSCPPPVDRSGEGTQPIYAYRVASDGGPCTIFYRDTEADPDYGGVPFEAVEISRLGVPDVG